MPLMFAVYKMATATQNASCDKILQCDCTTLYSAAGHSLYTQFTRPFPSLAEVGLACETTLQCVHGTPSGSRSELTPSIALARV